MALQMRQNFNLRMEQKLKLTPQMIQSIEILLLPQLALDACILARVSRDVQVMRRKHTSAPLPRLLPRRAILAA